MILKTDAYYSSARFPNPLPSTDCLIVVRCLEHNCFDLYLVELRNTASRNRLRHADIRRKFETVLTDFLGARFAHIFLAYEIREVRLYLVTDPFNIGAMGLTPAEWKKRMKGTLLDAYSQVLPVQFQGRPLAIEPVLPDPAIEDC